MPMNYEIWKLHDAELVKSMEKGELGEGMEALHPLHIFIWQLTYVLCNILDNKPGNSRQAFP